MKEYKVQLHKAPGAYAMIVVAFLQLCLIYLALRDIKEYWSLLLISFVFLGFVQFLGYYFLNIKVILDDGSIKVKKIDKLEVAKWEEITKVEKLMAVGAIRYIIRKKKGFLEFPDYVKDYEEILSEIEHRTGLKPKWGI